MIIKNENLDQMINLGIAGRTWVISVSKDGAVYYLSATSVMEEVADGNYVLHLSAEDMNGDLIIILIEETNDPSLNFDIIRFEVTINTDIITEETAEYLNHIQEDIEELKHQMYPGGGTVLWEYQMYTDSTKTVPLEGVLIKLSLDRQFTQTFEQTTDIYGVTKWFVNPGGTYYVWRQKECWKYKNPDVQQISLVAPFSN